MPPPGSPTDEVDAEDVLADFERTIPMEELSGGA
jgi:hypothetical protein